MIIMYNIFFINMSFIGSSQKCKENCYQKSKEAYDSPPHDQPINAKHQIMTLKQVNKKIGQFNITKIFTQIQQYEEKINHQIEELYNSIKQIVKKGIHHMKKRTLQQMSFDKDIIRDEHINTFTKLGNFQYEELKCYQISEIFKCIDRKKEVDPEFVLEETYKLIKQQIKCCTANLFSHITEGQQSIELVADNDKSQKDSRKEELKRVDTIDMTQFEEDSSELDVTIVFNDQESEENILEKVNISKISMRTQSILERSEYGIFMFEGHEEKIDYKMKKSSEGTKIEELSSSEKSYVKKDEGKYYIRVNHLLGKKYKEEKTPFNIILKVERILIYRFFKDHKSKKSFKKIKLVGGDQTGIVVCYINYVENLTQGSYIGLYDCELNNFNQFSYQIQCRKCKVLVGKKQNFEINKQSTVSRFLYMEPLVYNAQKFDPYWPSILGMAMSEKKKQKFNIIGQICEIIYQEKNKIQCFLMDGTAKIFTIIFKQQETQYAIGDIFYIKSMSIINESNGNKNQKFYYITINDSNITPLKGFNYGTPQIMNINEVLNQKK